MAIHREQQRRTVLLATLVVAWAAISSAAGQAAAATRTTDRGADAHGRAAVSVAQMTRSSRNHHPASGHGRAAVTNPYSLARRFHQGAAATAAVSA